MKFALKVTAAAVTATALLASAAAAETIRFVNRTGASIMYVYGTDSNQPTFGTDDLLQQYVFGPGQTWTWTVYNVTNCSYDFRFVFANGQYFDQYGVNVCNGATYNVN